MNKLLLLLLATALKTNTALKNLDLSDNDLGPADAESLATALKPNTTLTNLDLSHNYLGPASAESLATALKTNTTLTNLNLSDNDLSPRQIEPARLIMSSCHQPVTFKKKPFPLDEQ